jgi:GT2 family glycosyltransferase
MPDLVVIIVAHNPGPLIRRALDSLWGPLGELDAEVLVVDNGTDGTGDLIKSAYPRVGVIKSPNLGFAHGNNAGLRVTDARHVLLLNPDTEILQGSLESLVETLDRDPMVGLVGVRQELPSGDVARTMRRFPSPLRAFGEALGSERLPVRASWLGERELDPGSYRQERDCDWVSGSFMLIRGEALNAVGWLDERFFLYSEETDLCRRIKAAGWQVRYTPTVTILHHEGDSGIVPELESQLVYSRLQYAQKHFSRPARTAFRVALLLRYLLRAAVRGRSRDEGSGGAVARAGLKTALRGGPPPLREPPATALSCVD